MKPLREMALAGEALSGEKVIDCHGHLGRWGPFYVPRCTAADIIATMDRLGITAIVASAHRAIGPDFVVGNEHAAQAAQEHRGHFFFYAAVNPNYRREGITAELERRAREPGFVGVKLHPDVHRQPANADGYVAAWEFAHDRALPVLSHTWHGSQFDPPGMFRDLAKTYNRATIILGHSGGSPAGNKESAQVARECENVFLDICGSQHHYRSLESLVEQVGAERVLFGTDLPFIDPRPQLGRVLMSRLSDEQKRAILGLNALRIFSINIHPVSENSPNAQRSRGRPRRMGGRGAQ